MQRRFATQVAMLAMFAVAALTLSKAEDGGPQGGATGVAQWTILIFMNGDNNLEPDALLNFRQLARVGSTADVNVVVQFDRITKYAHTQPDWPQTLRFRVGKDMEPLPANALEDIGEADMGDGKVLADFVTWGMQKFAARHYMLVIWDHGQGWRLFVADLLKRHRLVQGSRTTILADDAGSLRASSVLLRATEGVASQAGQTAPFRSAPGDAYRSVSNDETNQDVLYNRKIQDSLEGSLYGKKIDIIAFDACLMSMIETAYALRNVGHYMIGSEELEPGPGWKYDDWLQALEANPSQDPLALARMTVDQYGKAYPPSSDDGPSVTLSAFDLSRTQDLAASISTLSESLMAKLDSVLQSVIEARAATMAYAPGYTFYHVDIGQFVNQLSARTSDPDVKAKALSSLSILSDAVVANYVGPDRLGAYGSKGLAIYFPGSEHDHLNDPYAEGGYEKDNQFYPVEFVQREKWTDFLHSYWSKVP